MPVHFNILFLSLATKITLNRISIVYLMMILNFFFFCLYGSPSFYAKYKHSHNQTNVRHSDDEIRSANDAELNNTIETVFELNLLFFR